MTSGVAQPPLLPALQSLARGRRRPPATGHSDYGHTRAHHPGGEDASLATYARSRIDRSKADWRVRDIHASQKHQQTTETRHL